MSLAIRFDVVPIDPMEAPSWVEELTLTQYTQVAALTVLVYDINRILLSSPFKTVAFVYFANRYLGLFGAIANILWNTYVSNFDLCNFSIFATNISTWITIILIDYILMIRVLALYSRQKLLSMWLMALLAIEAVAKFVFALYLNLGINDTVFVVALSNNVTFCDEGLDNSIWIIVDWAITLVYGLILMALALYQATDFWRVSRGFKGLTLIKVIIRDQAIYYAAVISFCIFNILNSRLTTNNIITGAFIDFLGSPTFLCILGSRLLFNLKDAGKHGVNEGTNHRPEKPASDTDSGAAEAEAEASEMASENALS